MRPSATGHRSIRYFGQSLSSRQLESGERYYRLPIAPELKMPAVAEVRGPLAQCAQDFRLQTRRAGLSRQPARTAREQNISALLLLDDALELCYTTWRSCPSDVGAAGRHSSAPRSTVGN